MKIIRQKLEGGATFPKKVRLNETTGEVEETYDGGETWVENPLMDPRTSPALIQAIPNGTRCDTATNMRDFIQAQVEGIVGIFADFGVAGGVVGAIVTFLLSAFQLLGPFGIIFTVFFALAAYLVELGSTALELAFANGEWDDLLCVFYDLVPSDGIVTESAFSAIQARVSSVFDGAAETIIYNFLSIMGSTGLTNAGKHGTGGADCGDCSDIWCYTFNFLVSDGSWAKALGAGYGTYVGGTGWRAVGQALYIQRTFASAVVTRVEAVINSSGYKTSPQTNVGLYYGSPSAPTLIGGAEKNMPDGRHTYIWDNLALTLTNLLINPNDATYYSNLERITIYGTGANPFGADNC